jgi:hypothetical protein
MTHGHKVLEIAKEAQHDNKVQRYLKDEVLKLIQELKVRS